MCELLTQWNILFSNTFIDHALVHNLSTATMYLFAQDILLLLLADEEYTFYNSIVITCAFNFKFGNWMHILLGKGQEVGLLIHDLRNLGTRLAYVYCL